MLKQHHRKDKNCCWHRAKTMDETTTETLSGGISAAQSVFFSSIISYFLAHKLPPLRLTGIQCCGVFKKTCFLKFFKENYVEEPQAVGSACGPSESGLLLNSRPRLFTNFVRFISVLHRLQINRFNLVSFFLSFDITTHFLLTSENFLYWTSLSSCSSFKSDIRIVRHLRSCRLGNC